MPSTPQSKLIPTDMEDLVPYASESSSKVITKWEPSPLEMLERPRSVSDMSWMDDESSETDSNKDPCTNAKLDYEVSLYYFSGIIADDAIRYDPARIHSHALAANYHTATTLRGAANPRKLTPTTRSECIQKSTPAKVTRNYKHKKTNILQIANPELVMTCTIARVSTKSGKGRTKSISRASPWVQNPPLVLHVGPTSRLLKDC